MQCSFSAKFPCPANSANNSIARHPAVAYDDPILIPWMLGTALNCAAILIGGCAGLGRHGRLSARLQSQIKVGLGAATAFIGLKILWVSLSGGFSRISRGVLLLLVALALGKLAGRRLHFQRFSNGLGRFAREQIAGREPNAAPSPAIGFKVCAALFCAAPLAFLGPVEEALEANLYPILVKSFLDGLATFAFAGMFGRGVVLSVVPVAALQGSIWMLADRLEPFLRARDLVDSISGVCGFLIFCVALIILEIRRVEVADYLPSLVVAPLLALIWK